MALAADRRRLNNLLSKIKTKNLQEWLSEASKIPELASALEGIYCGREGKINEELSCGKLYISMEWYCIDGPARVEYAYVS